MQYADFARWQNQWMSGDRLQSHVAYWKRKLGGSLQELKLPSDYPQSARQGHQGGSQSITLSKPLSDRVKAFSQEQGVTLFITLVAAFKALLHGYTGQTDIVISTGIANRTRAETEGLVGFFVNLLILRTNLSGAPTVVELLGRVRETVLEAY